MNEQEKIELPIDEISKLICRLDLRFGSCEGDCHLHNNCLFVATATDIVNACYRKEEEVRREERKKIYEMAKGIMSTVI